MTHRQGQDSQGSYIDGIVVKISEQYKPPPRISLPITYAQRLSLNKQIQDSMPSYEFTLESTVKEQIEALKNARNCITQSSQKRAEIIREERRKWEEQRQKEVEIKEKEVLNSEMINSSNLSQLVTNSLYIAPETSQTYTSNPGILVPTQIASYSNILTPIPLKSSIATNNINCKPTDRSPFNISDFEADTSSPFDNMELKTLNDMEELAQVLKREEPTYSTANVPQIYPVYAPVQNVARGSEYTHYTYCDGRLGMTQTLDMYPASTKIASYNQQIYSRTNGYNFSPDADPIKASNFGYSFMDFTSDSNVKQNTKSSTKSVPDIMKALETELDNHHINNTHLQHSSYIKTHNSIQRENSTPIISKVKDDLDDPYRTLPKNLQDLCTTISLMGFPLPRVARACKLLGEDHKKVKI